MYPKLFYPIQNVYIVAYTEKNNNNNKKKQTKKQFMVQLIQDLEVVSFCQKNVHKYWLQVTAQ